jgi:hypothetical protein
LGKLVKLEQSEVRAKDLRERIFDTETSMKMQEDAGTSKILNVVLITG